MEWIYPILGKQKCLPFYLSGVGIAEPEYHVIREEGLVSHQLHYTQSGRGNLVVGGATYPLEPGSMFYMAPGIPHEYYPLVEDEWTTCWLVFRGEHLLELMKGMGFDGFAYDKNIVNEKITGIFHQMLKAAKDPLYGDERCSMLVYEYIMNVRQAFLANKKYGGQSAKSMLQRALMFIHKNYARDITLEELAEMSGVTKQHFPITKERAKPAFCSASLYHVKLVPCLFLQSVGVMPSYFLNTMPKYVGFSYPTSAPICAMLLSVANNILLATETRCLARYSIGRIRISQYCR